MRSPFSISSVTPLTAVQVRRGRNGCSRSSRYRLAIGNRIVTLRTATILAFRASPSEEEGTSTAWDFVTTIPRRSRPGAARDQYGPRLKTFPHDSALGAESWPCFQRFVQDAFCRQ